MTNKLFGAYRDFAIERHNGQIRKYTNEPYWHHLEEVAEYTSLVHYDKSVLAVAWLHDVLEDTQTTFEEVQERFGQMVAKSVFMLSDLTPHMEGNRAYRKRRYLEKVANGDSIVQTIKVADLISNTSSIVIHDENFARTYLKEKQELIAVLIKADPRLLRIAKSMIDISLHALKDGNT